MEAPRESPMPPANAPFNPSAAPLAPSQEAAYRRKCVQLKKRLDEIEKNNDVTRRRIEQEKQHLTKMRLLRAILLERVKQAAVQPGKSFSRRDLESLGVGSDGTAHISELVGMEDQIRPEGEALLDDSSEESEEDPEPAERPERRRRPNKNFRESIMTTTPGPNPSMYQPATGLPSLAPATAFNNNVPPEPASLTGSFRVHATPQTTPFANPIHVTEQQSSPVPASQSQSGSFSRGGRHSGARSISPGHPTGTRPAPGPQPPRPQAPFDQFTSHMRPQLEADNYPPQQIQERIEQEWRDLSPENRGLWEKRYQEQMSEYTTEMDVWKKEQKKANNSVTGVSFSESRNRN